MDKPGIRLVLGIVLLLSFCLASLWYLGKTEQKPLQESPADELSGWRLGYSPADLDLLARVVRAEAQGEPYDGQIAVAAVVLNRINHPEFPNTIPGVIYEPLAFTVVANGRINHPADQQAIQAAQAALNGLDPSGGALYFYNPSKTGDAWIRRKQVLKTIGGHVFAG